MRPTQRLFAFSWQGLGDQNITLTDELDFDISEHNFIYD